jgi:hypothetical protein
MISTSKGDSSGDIGVVALEEAKVLANGSPTSGLDNNDEEQVLKTTS